MSKNTKNDNQTGQSQPQVSQENDTATLQNQSHKLLQLIPLLIGYLFYNLFIVNINTSSANIGFTGIDQILGKMFYCKFDQSYQESAIVKKLSNSKFTLKSFILDTLPPLLLKIGSNIKIMPQCYLVASEYMRHGSLLELLIKSLEKKRPLSVRIRYYLCRSLYTACQYLWKKDRICHNDLKPDNILINDDFTLRLCDFGHSSKFTDVLEYPVGTMNYRAFEINEGVKSYSAAKAEIFAFASVIFSIFFCR